MKIAIAQAYNGVHNKISRELKKIGIKTSFFDIDRADWFKQIKKLNKTTSAYFWNADDKGKYYYQINDRVYLLEQLTNKPIFPDTKQYFFYNDKISQFNFLKFNGFPCPPTFISNQKSESLKYISKIKYPFVLKDAHSASAMGVWLVKSNSEAKKIIDQIFSPTGYSGIFGHFYAQKFIPNLEKDLRIITIGNEVAAAYWRINKSDWRHNVGLGGQISGQNIPSAAKNLALKISQKASFHWMAYDIIMAGAKPLVLEFSCNFGVKGAEKLGINIRRLQAEYMINYLKSKK